MLAYGESCILFAWRSNDGRDGIHSGKVVGMPGGDKWTGNLRVSQTGSLSGMQQSNKYDTLSYLYLVLAQMSPVLHYHT